jgi:hypothetical protein
VILEGGNYLQFEKKIKGRGGGKTKGKAEKTSLIVSFDYRGFPLLSLPGGHGGEGSLVSDPIS